MKKLLALISLPFFLISLASNGLADELTLKAAGHNKWTIYNSGGQDIGTLSKVGKKEPKFVAGGYSIRPKGGRNLGVVTSNGDLQLLVRNATISPSDAQLYLDVLDAIKTLE